MALLLATLGGLAVQTASGEKLENCADKKDLLQDPEFSRIHANDGLWLYTQHTGDRSFALSTSEGELSIRRIGKEPWMIISQTITHGPIEGSTIRFSAELKGDAPARPPIHGFAHVAGLYLKVGNHRNAVIADHIPNNGSWGWQRVTVEKFIPEGISELRVGFVHQSGGTLWARSPTLTFVDCPVIEK